jgi:hypothetical protein
MQNEYSNVPEGNITELLQEIHRTVITNKQ